MLSILLGFRKHVRYVACMRARKLSLDIERLFVLSPGQIIYQRSISGVYSLRDRQIETIDNACTLVPTVFRWHKKMEFKFHFYFSFFFGLEKWNSISISIFHFLCTCDIEKRI